MLNGSTQQLNSVSTIFLLRKISMLVVELRVSQCYDPTMLRAVIWQQPTWTEKVSELVSLKLKGPSDQKIAPFLLIYLVTTIVANV